MSTTLESKGTSGTEPTDRRGSEGSTGIEGAVNAEALAEIRRQLEDHDKRLRDIPRGYGLFSFMAVLLALAALLAVAFKLDEVQSPGSVSSTPGRAGQMRGASGGMATPSGQGAGAASTTTVHVQLGDFFVRPSTDTVQAGRVTFHAKNMGQVPHELMVEPAPIKLDAPNQPNEDAALGMIQDINPMSHGRMTVSLKPGSYELFCNLPGHYAFGQHTPFTVTTG